MGLEEQIWWNRTKQATLGGWDATVKEEHTLWNKTVEEEAHKGLTGAI